jgi:hypothetical protein
MDGPLQRNPLKKVHARRLRALYRSAGWPCLEMVEIELLAAGLLQKLTDPGGHERVRVTDSGIHYLASMAQNNRSGGQGHWKDCMPNVFSIRSGSAWHCHLGSGWRWPKPRP